MRRHEKRVCDLLSRYTQNGVHMATILSLNYHEITKDP